MSPRGDPRKNDKEVAFEFYPSGKLKSKRISCGYCPFNYQIEFYETGERKMFRYNFYISDVGDPNRFEFYKSGNLESKSWEVHLDVCLNRPEKDDLLGDNGLPTIIDFYETGEVMRKTWNLEGSCHRVIDYDKSHHRVQTTFFDEFGDKPTRRIFYDNNIPVRQEHYNVDGTITSVDTEPEKMKFKYRCTSPQSCYDPFYDEDEEDEDKDKVAKFDDNKSECDQYEDAYVNDGYSIDNDSDNNSHTSANHKSEDSETSSNSDNDSHTSENSETSGSSE